MGKTKVISVLNHKGGVGKTITTINLSGVLRQKGYKVFLIDLCGQPNRIAGRLGGGDKTIYIAIKSEYDLPIYEYKDGLSVVLSSLNLSATKTELTNGAGRGLILVHLIETQKENFDYTLIDCPSRCHCSRLTH